MPTKTLKMLGKSRCGDSANATDSVTHRSLAFLLSLSLFPACKSHQFLVISNYGHICKCSQDSWEDSDDDEAVAAKKAAAAAAANGPAPPVRQKGITKAKIAEKEAAERAKLEAALANSQEDPREKRKRELQAQMAQDLEAARSLFGDAKVADAIGGGGGSDNPLNAVQNPRTKQDWQKLAEAISKSIVDSHSTKPLYPTFVEELVRSLCLPLKHLDVKQVNSTITALSNEKQKQEKDAQGTGKKGKGKGKPQLGVVGAGAAKAAVGGRGYAADLEAHDVAMDDDFDDFVGWHAWSAQSNH